MSHVLPALFAGNPASAAVWERLVGELDGLGALGVEEKKTSVHVTNARAAFLGVHPRKQGLRLNIVLATPLEGARVVKSERVSANRFHNEVDVKDPAEIDAELLGWIRQAYER
jgi:hypothetical protein